MIFNLSNNDYGINIIAFEANQNKFDITYFGFIKIMNYRTWCFFTQTQIEYMKKTVQFKENKEGLKNYTSGVHYNKKTAIDNKVYFNTFLFKMVTKYSPQRMKNLPSGFLTQYTFKPWKDNSAYIWLLSDREEVVFKEKTPFFHMMVDNFSLDRELNPIYNESVSFNEFCDKLVPEGASSDFKKQFYLFFKKNKLRHEHNAYSVNDKLFKICIFLKSNFHFDEIKSFKNYKKLVIFTFAHYSSFRSFLDGKNLDEWYYCFNTLQIKNKMKTYLSWYFYSSRIEEMTKVLKKLESFNLPYASHKSPLYAYNFYSKRYSQEQRKDFVLANTNSQEGYVLNNNVGKISLESFTLSLVKSWHELIQVGISLHNCAGNDEKLEEYKKSCSFVVKDLKGSVVYLGSIKRGRLIQLKGFKNSSPPISLFNEIVIKMKEQSIIIATNPYCEACFQSYR